MTDIVERLRDRYNKWGSTYRVSPPCELDEAADEIERLRARNSALEAQRVPDGLTHMFLLNTAMCVESREAGSDETRRQMTTKLLAMADQLPVTPQPAPAPSAPAPSAPAEVEGERQAFEVWYARAAPTAVNLALLRSGDAYLESHMEINVAWEAWQARAQLGAAPEYNGWYCAQCERGVDPSEVTFNEAHTECGRIITNDRPPALTATGGRGEYVRGVQAMATEAKQLCRDFSDLRDRPYMGDVTVAIDALAEQVAAAQPAKEQKL